MYKKIKEYNFRELDRKIVSLKSIAKKFDNYGIKDLNNPFLGVLYIDADLGFSLRVFGNENDKDMQNEYINNTCQLVRNDCFEDLEFEIYDKEIEGLDLNKHFDVYYNYPSLIKMRKIEELDKFRHPLYPDDVQVLIPFKEKPELLWAKLIDKTEIEGLYIVSLLNESYIDKELKEGTFIACKPREIQGNDYLVIEGILEKK